MEQEYVINQISDRLNQLSDRLKSREHSATVLEGVCHKLFDALFGWNLSNLNQEHYSFAAVDLGDKAQRVAIQITVQDGSGKATHTLRQIDSAGHRQHYSLFICFFLVPKAPGSHTADPPDFHRWGIRDLIEGILKPLHVPDWLKPFVPSTHHSLSITALQRSLAVLEETLADRRFAPQPPKRLAYHLHPDAHAGFIGRKDLLKDLRTALKPGKKNVIQQAKAVHADGGVGKTSLAIHLGAELFAKETFDYVLFLAATSADALRGDLTALCNAQYLNLPAQEAREAALQYQAVLAFLSQPEVSSRTLLILDGADDETAREAVSDLRGELTNCAFLITSRHSEWGKGVTPFPLELFTDAEARDFLRDRFGESTTIPDELLDTIARELGHLPLALEIAASYIRSQRLRPEDWLQEWQNAPTATYEHHSKDHLHYPLPLGRIWDQSFARLDESARQLLHILAFIAPRPAALPLETFEKLPQWPTLRQSLATLAAASLIQWDGGEKTLLIHRLLQAVTRQRLTTEETQTAVSTGLNWLSKLLPDTEWTISGWGLWRLFEPHLCSLLAVTGAETGFQPAGTSLSYVLSQYAVWLNYRAKLSEAEVYYRRSLQLDEASFGRDHPTVAIRCNNLANLLLDTNRLKESEDLMRRALLIFEKRLGKKQSWAATAYNNLARILKATNRLEKAEPLYRAALEIEEICSGSGSPKLIVRLNNLATLLCETGRQKDAEPLFVRALELAKFHYGPKHPNVARVLSGLASTFQDMGRSEDAEKLMRVALEINEACFGPQHPAVSGDLNNLAVLLQLTNRLDEAEKLYLRALNIDQRTFKPDDPHIARDLNNIASLFQITNRAMDAEILMLKALEIEEASYGPEHPNVARGLNNLAQLYRTTGRFQEADKLTRRHLIIIARFTARNGYLHQHQLAGMNNYNAILVEMGYSEPEAREMVLSALREGGMTPEQIQQIVSS